MPQPHPPAVRNPNYRGIACNPNYRGEKIRPKKIELSFLCLNPTPPAVHNPNYRGIACKKFLAHTPANEKKKYGRAKIYHTVVR